MERGIKLRRTEVGGGTYKSEGAARATNEQRTSNEQPSNEHVRRTMCDFHLWPAATVIDCGRHGAAVQPTAAEGTTAFDSVTALPPPDATPVTVASPVL